MNPTEVRNLVSKVKKYREVIENTLEYRKAWKENLKNEIIEDLEEMIELSGLEAKVISKTQIENLEAVVVTLGQSKSGLFQKVSDEVDRHMIKHNGSLLYQQLFNGKIMVMINYPYIENYGKPHQPKTLAIYRPEELKKPYLVRHMEEFISEITLMEDFDDDEPNQKIGFELNFQEEMDQ
ncbi:MAG: hypothetical protein GVX78_04800 [Bacteroidetes bacterium]|jgi:hypothetical protein|nr:hypothetical protein [Bacteroidota bacterium]